MLVCYHWMPTTHRRWYFWRKQKKWVVASLMLCAIVKAFFRSLCVSNQTLNRSCERWWARNRKKSFLDEARSLHGLEQKAIFCSAQSEKNGGNRLCLRNRPDMPECQMTEKVTNKERTSARGAWTKLEKVIRREKYANWKIISRRKDLPPEVTPTRKAESAKRRSVLRDLARRRDDGDDDDAAVYVVCSRVRRWATGNWIFR